jgi:thiol-disulfide isomerase/thioredoxin
MKILKPLLLIINVFLFFQVHSSSLQQGPWEGQFSLNDSTLISFSFSVNEHDHLILQNADERIALTELKKKGDSLIYEFPIYQTYLIFKKKNRYSIDGYFVNPDRKKNGKIKFIAHYLEKSKTEHHQKVSKSINGNWEVTFSPDTRRSYPAIGKFIQEKNGKVTGTFLTETGDYRFLEGKFKNDSLVVSCFDGSHLFLFNAKLIENKLHGSFYSGSHWHTNWVAKRNPNFQLTHPDSLTTLVKDTFHFNHPDLENNSYQFPNEETRGKVTIIQIMGTWCPNCLDEANFYKQLYNDYHNDGLEIIAIAYEYPETFHEQVARVNHYLKYKELPYPVLIGGHASKKEASADFNMLNKITSFPTSIFINRKGEVVKIHTGFSGPGTGEIYNDYVKKTKLLLEKLLIE